MRIHMVFRGFGTAIAAGSVLLLAGCGAGHGKYTSEHITLAQARLNSLKAATEYDMAEQAFLAGDLEKAEKKLRKTIGMSEAMTRAHVLSARVAIERGDLGGALRMLDRAAELDAGSVDAAYYAGIVLERLQRNEEALAAFERAAELESYEPRYVIAAAETLIDLGRPDEAAALLDESPAASHSAGIRQLLGHIAIMAGDADTAVDRFSEARLLAPDEPAIVEDLIRAQMASGLFREAERGLARLRRRPESSERRDLRHQQATCMIELGRPTEARALFRGLTQEIDGAGDIEAWSGLGETAYLLGDDGDLRRAASRVMSIAPREETGYVLFAMYHLLRNDTDAALKAVEDGVSRAGGHVELLSLRAVAFARAGRNAEADATLAQMESGSHNDAAARVRKAIGASDYAGVTTD